MIAQLRLDTCNFAHLESTVPTEDYLIHAHDCYELYYIVRGDLNFLYDGTEYRLPPHTLMLNAPRILHGIHVLSDRPYNRYTFHFVPAFFPQGIQSDVLKLLPTVQTVRSASSPIPFMVANAQAYDIQSQLDEILALSGRDEISRKTFAPILLEALLIRLYLKCTDNSVTLPTVTRADPPELAAVLDYLRRHLSDRITVEELAERFFISRTKLNNLFRQHFHTSIMNYVTAQRLSYAQKLLASGMPAYEVAPTTGYPDYSTFYRSYTRHFGRTPRKDKSVIHFSSMNMPGIPSGESFADPFAVLDEQNPPATVLPDIGFENHAYDPLET